MNFLVIEGIDGSGKSTQVKLLLSYLESHHMPYKYLHFPRTDAPVFGDLIARFLRGSFGAINDVDPYLVALLYAGDRFDAAPHIQRWIDEGYFVILDRYVYSNIAFQCAKVSDSIKRHTLKDWILRLEFDYYHIPKPDLNLFLDVPAAFTRNNLSAIRKGNDREYLMGMKDIHEDDLFFQQKVREMYLWQVKENRDFSSIDCMNEQGVIKSPEAIFNEILDKIKL
ncbi:MAG: dTMP kinase [Bacteroidales bacterium]|nr:dTMP kinase [Bacteroidales bacterium]